MELLIKNGRILDPSTNLDFIGDIYIKNGIIEEIGQDLQYSAEKLIDAKGLWVTPGLIDVHVHLREPGQEYKEDIESGSRSAAKGGFTTICCMPNTKPVVDNEVVVEYINMKAKKAGLVNVLPIGAITKGQEGEILANIGKMAEAGICAISEDGKSVLDANLLRKAMQYASMFDLPILSHCEEPSLATGFMNAGEMSALLGMKEIYPESEEIIVARDIILANNAKAKLHLCHLSTKGSIQLLKEAKLRGEIVTAEVTPHHFTLTEEAVEGYDTNTKVNPPLRTRIDVEAIKCGLRDGIVDIIATDHAPHHIDEKNCEYEVAANGIVGLETSVSLTITELVNKGYLTPIGLVEKMSTNPARMLGIDKGTLEIGKIADITIINPSIEYVVNGQEFESKSKNTPFNGMKLQGKAMYTIVGGQVIMEDGKIRGEIQ
ncbi:MAG: dihydroorotase [Tissierellia bacterium]|nr:dihydroorotase [Tissierellia bacterium]MDD4726922.1 dihydroorotase [Tissierellia bacterium]